MLAVRIVLIVVGAIVLLGLIAGYCYWKRQRDNQGLDQGQEHRSL